MTASFFKLRLVLTALLMALLLTGCADETTLVPRFDPADISTWVHEDATRTVSDKALEVIREGQYLEYIIQRLGKPQAILSTDPIKLLWNTDGGHRLILTVHAQALTHSIPLEGEETRQCDATVYYIYRVEIDPPGIPQA